MLPTSKMIMYALAVFLPGLLLYAIAWGVQSGKQGKVVVAPPVLAFVNNTGLYLAKDGTVMFVDNGVFSKGGTPLNLKCDPPKPGPMNFEHCKAAPIPKCAK
jgi:hypothetical protein